MCPAHHQPDFFDRQALRRPRRGKAPFVQRRETVGDFHKFVQILTDYHERRASGRVRLRKQAYTTTETVEVPVTREEVVVERESVDPNSAEARTAGRDGDVEVTTYEETPVVNKTVDAEKVSLGKRQVQDTETVTEEVRHEDVKVDGDATDRDLDGRNDRKDRI